MQAADTFFLNIFFSKPLVSIQTAHIDCAHTIIFCLELKIVEFETRILHNTVPIAVLYWGTKA